MKEQKNDALKETTQNILNSLLKETEITDDMIYDTFPVGDDMIVVIDMTKVDENSKDELLFTKQVINENGEVELIELNDEEFENALKEKEHLEKIFKGEE